MPKKKTAITIRRHGLSWTEIHRAWARLKDRYIDHMHQPWITSFVTFHRDVAGGGVQVWSSAASTIRTRSVPATSNGRNRSHPKIHPGSRACPGIAVETNGMPT